MTESAYLCLHGHFYQPPRENPWIEELEAQSSAAPFHDWNERIWHECYYPNTRARILDDRQRVVDIVSNFELMSFNFGPTILSWLEEKHPHTYQAILSADKKSAEARNGHGNAIAQAYNHMIMPLANRRDKVTQVRWGLRDFEKRFGRKPSSMWLPETACNEETLEVLVEEGMRYVILEPHQAQAVRTLDGEDWTDVGNGSIDPGKPYRCFLKKDPSRFIDIFFYDGPISKAVGFEELLFDAKMFMDRIDTARAPENGDGPRLISIGTDGETYGHHKAYGDRVLAYLLSAEAPARGYKVVNYGEFLEKHPPRYAVRLKDGENNEGTSWSCAHGVKRWKENCGCRGGGPAEWTQEWRGPLREALDWLRDQLGVIFQEKGSEYLKDPWVAREEYIDVVLDRSPENVKAFIEKHQTRPLASHEVLTVLYLLEIQREAMLMYTSCGWFFTELSGLETVQILRYAARAIQLAELAAGRSLENDFLERLAKAKSNMPEFRDGRGVYDALVRPSIASLKMLAAQYAIRSLIHREEDGFRLKHFSLDLLHRRQESYGGLVLEFGRVKVRSRLTTAERDLVFIALQFGTFDFRCSLKAFESQEDMVALEKKIFEGLTGLHVVELLRKIDDLFGKEYYALRDLLLAERTELISLLTKEKMRTVDEVYNRLFDENRRMNEMYRSVNLPIPEELRYATLYSLNRRLETEMKKLAAESFDLRKAHAVTKTIDMAKDFGVILKKDGVWKIMTEEISRRSREITACVRESFFGEAINDEKLSCAVTRAEECLKIMKLARKIGVTLSLRVPQENTLELLKTMAASSRSIPASWVEFWEGLIDLAEEVEINPARFEARFKELKKAASPAAQAAPSEGGVS